MKEVENSREKKYKEYVYSSSWAYTRKISAIALGATPIESAGRAPDDIYQWILKQRRREKIQKASLITPIGREFFLLI
jgi:hypothetical protein